jgi:hypothetical protein
MPSNSGAYAFNPDKSKNDLSDIVRTADIADVVRTADVTDVVRTGDLDVAWGSGHTIQGGSWTLTDSDTLPKIYDNDPFVNGESPESGFIQFCFFSNISGDIPVIELLINSETAYTMKGEYIVPDRLAVSPPIPVAKDDVLSFKFLKSDYNTVMLTVYLWLQPYKSATS